MRLLGPRHLVAQISHLLCMLYHHSLLCTYYGNIYSVND